MHWPAAMGIDWMRREELTQAIPPAYTEHIGHYLLAELNARTPPPPRTTP
jgi:DNA (cytosine-5)-methyltransferase 1